MPPFHQGLFLRSARSGSDYPRSIIFDPPPPDCRHVSPPTAPFFFNQIESRSMDHCWGTILGRSSRDRHVSGSKVRAGTKCIRQRPDKGPIKTRFSRARERFSGVVRPKMNDPGLREDALCQCAADFRRSTAVFRARVAESVRMLTQLAESKRS